MSRRLKPEQPDKDNPEWSAEEVAQAVQYAALPDTLRSKLSGLRKRGPQKTETKERITIRLSRSVVERFRATGEGWQTRMDAALQDWLKSHSLQ